MSGRLVRVSCLCVPVLQVNKMIASIDTDGSGTGEFCEAPSRLVLQWRPCECARNRTSRARTDCDRIALAPLSRRRRVKNLVSFVSV